jgi:HlyD family secretion protein
MKKFLLLFIVLAIVVFTTIYLYFETQSKDTDTLVLYGNVDVRQVDLGFRVSGRVQALTYEEGDLVPQGALMAILDKQPYEDLVKQSTASLGSTIASLANAEQLLKRRQELVGDGSIAQEDLDIALTNRNVLIANKMESAAALSVAKTNLGFTELYAPTEGTILTRVREPGTVVNPAEPVYTLTIINPVWVRAYVHEQELGLIYPGMPAQIYTDTQDGKIYHGKIGFISPVAEFTPKTVETTQLRTDLVYRLRIYADNPDKGLRQGMPVTVKLDLNQVNR